MILYIVRNPFMFFGPIATSDFKAEMRPKIKPNERWAIARGADGAKN